MAEAPVITDPFTDAADRLKTLNKVMTTKAAIAQTPKELVWTLNKAKLYRYIPVVPKEKRHPGSAVAGFRSDEPAVHSRSSPRPQLCRVHGEPGIRSVSARLGSSGTGRQEPEV